MKSLVEVEVDNIHCSPLIYPNLILKGHCLPAEKIPSVQLKLILMGYIYKNITLEMIFQNIFIFRVHPTVFMQFSIGILTDTLVQLISTVQFFRSLSIFRYRKDNSTMNICETTAKI